MKWPRHPWQWFALGLASVLLITVSLAPWQGNAQRGVSSYSRTPEGYGAWYTYLQTQTNACVGRWHRSLADLQGQGTLVRVSPDLQGFYLPPALSEWASRGNTVILLGVWSPISAAPFTRKLASSEGDVKIDTRRRTEVLDQRPIRTLLGDGYGDVVWMMSQGKGTVIGVTTPYFGANAYQNEPGNFPFLAKIAQPPAGVLWFDESDSGYPPLESPTLESDASAPSAACLQQVAQGQPQASSNDTAEPVDAFVYLLQTPWSLVLLQSVVGLGLLIIAQNRRFGLPQPIPDRQPENTMAYIHALATVLEKAGCHDFVVAGILKAEQRYVQQRLGLGTTLLEPTTVLDSWTQMGYPPEILSRGLIQFPAQPCREQELVTWLQDWKQVHRVLSQPVSAQTSPAASASTPDI